MRFSSSRFDVADLRQRETTLAALERPAADFQRAEFRCEIAQLRIGHTLIVKHQDRVAVDGIPDRTQIAGIHRLAEIDTVNLGGERWT